MQGQNIIQQKSFDFSVEIVKFHREASKSNVDYSLLRQLLKSSTSIGANVEEAIGAISKKDFLLKITIAYKEARETCYWLRLFLSAQLANHGQIHPLLTSCEELLKILGAIISSTKRNLSR